MNALLLAPTIRKNGQYKVSHLTILYPINATYSIFLQGIVSSST